MLTNPNQSVNKTIDIETEMDKFEPERSQKSTFVETAAALNRPSAQPIPVTCRRVGRVRQPSPEH